MRPLALRDPESGLTVRRAACDRNAQWWRPDHDKVETAAGGARGLDGSGRGGVWVAGRSGAIRSEISWTERPEASSTRNCPCATNWQIRQLSAASRGD